MIMIDQPGDVVDDYDHMHPLKISLYIAIYIAIYI